MASGAFTQGSTIEFSCDGPVRPPYIAYQQGGLTYEYGKLAVIKEVLLYYRTHSKQITTTNRAEQDLSAKNIHIRRLGRIGISPSEKEYRCHELLARGVDKNISTNEVEQWVNKVLLNNERSGLVAPKALLRDLKSRFILYKFRNRKNLGVKDFFPL